MLRMLHISTKNEINAREYERIWLQRQVESIEIAELLLARERLPVTESAEKVAPPLQRKPQQEPQSRWHKLRQARLTVDLERKEEAAAAQAAEDQATKAAEQARQARLAVDHERDAPERRIWLQRPVESIEVDELPSTRVAPPPEWKQEARLPELNEVETESAESAELAESAEAAALPLQLQPQQEPQSRWHRRRQARLAVDLEREISAYAPASAREAAPAGVAAAENKTRGARAPDPRSPGPRSPANPMKAWIRKATSFGDRPPKSPRTKAAAAESAEPAATKAAEEAATPMGEGEASASAKETDKPEPSAQNQLLNHLLRRVLSHHIETVVVPRAEEAEEDERSRFSLSGKTATLVAFTTLLLYALLWAVELFVVASGAPAAANVRAQAARLHEEYLATKLKSTHVFSRDPDVYAAAAKLDAFARAEHSKWELISTQPGPCFYNHCVSHEKSTSAALVSELEHVRLSLTSVLGTYDVFWGLAKDEL